MCVTAKSIQITSKELIKTYSFSILLKWFKTMIYLKKWRFFIKILIENLQEKLKNSDFFKKQSIPN